MTRTARLDKPIEAIQKTDRSNTLVAFCTCPSASVAEQLARLVVEQRAAACVNIIPGIRSVYRWQGQITVDEECLLLIKTTDVGFTELTALINEAHPYELPEVIAVTIEQGLPAYLKWIEEQIG